MATKTPKKHLDHRYYGAGALILIAVAILLICQPTTVDNWATIAQEKKLALGARTFQIEPIALLHTIHDHKLNLIMLDVRNEADYKLIHIMDAQNVTVDELHEQIDKYIAEPSNTVFVVMSNDVTKATEA